MKKIFIVFVLMMCSIMLFAHSPLLTVEDNGDGTIYVQGGFSNGASAAGVKLYLTDKASGQKIWEGEFPDVGELNLPIPNVPYTVTFDAGPCWPAASWTTTRSWGPSSARWSARASP